MHFNKPGDAIPGIEDEEVCGEGVEGDVEEVVGAGAAPREGVVEPEGGGGEGAERLVRPAVRERGAPEVVDQEVGEGGVGPDVVVLEYCPPGRENNKVSE